MRNLARDNFMNTIIRPAVREAADRGLCLASQAKELERLCRQWLAKVYRKSRSTKDMARFGAMVEQFLDSATVADPSATTSLPALHGALKGWSQSHFNLVPPCNVLLLALRRRGLRRPTSGANSYRGIRLKPAWAETRPG